MEKIYIVYGNLNRSNDPDYKIHGAFWRFDSALSFAQEIAEDASSDKVTETFMPENVDDNVTFSFTTDDWEVEIYIAEIPLK